MVLGHCNYSHLIYILLLLINNLHKSTIQQVRDWQAQIERECVDSDVIHCMMAKSMLYALVALTYQKADTYMKVDIECRERSLNWRR